jgi:protein-tyrosine sulfotransferase
MPESSKQPELILILGAARSGTTLLRSLLDAHPEIGCPAEAGLPALISHARRVWATVCASDDPSPKDPLGAAALEMAPTEAVMPLPMHAEREIRRTARAMMKFYCRRDGQRIYCDKSLDTAQHLPAVYHSFPNTKCIILVRHVMDTIASGLEASPWGFNAFGYGPFVQASPDNTVMALARYWEMQVSLALKWEANRSESCHRVRYEDLVTNPAETLSGVFEFLEVDHDMSVLVRGFSQFSASSGPGDYKLAFTRTVSTGSVGRGKQVPVGMIPPPLIERLNELLEQLGYLRLTAAWNAEPRPGNSVPESSRRQLVELMESMQDGEWTFDIESVAIVADDDTDLRWVVEPRSAIVRQGDGEVDVAITGAAEDLVRMMRGEANIGVLMRSGRIRHITAGAPSDAPIDMPRVISSFVDRFAAHHGPES